MLGMSQAATGKNNFFKEKKGIFLEQKKGFFRGTQVLEAKVLLCDEKILFFLGKKSLLLRATEKGFFSKAREWLSPKKIPFLGPETRLSTQDLRRSRALAAAGA